MSADCELFQRDLPALLDSELDRQEMAAALGHALSCRACARETEGHLAAWKLLRQAHPDASLPRELRENPFARSRSAWIPAAWGFSLAAAGVFLALALTRSPESEPQRVFARPPKRAALFPSGGPFPIPLSRDFEPSTGLAAAPSLGGGEPALPLKPLAGGGAGLSLRPLASDSAPRLEAPPKPGDAKPLLQAAPLAAHRNELTEEI